MVAYWFTTTEIPQMKPEIGLCTQGARGDCRKGQSNPDGQSAGFLSKATYM